MFKLKSQKKLDKKLILKKLKLNKSLILNFNKNNKLISYYKNQFLRLINFIKHYFDFINHNQFFFFFSSCNIIDLKKIIYIIKKNLKIKIIDVLPSKELYLIQNTSLNKNNYNQNKYKKNIKKKIQKKNFFKNLYINKVKNINFFSKNQKHTDHKDIINYLKESLKILKKNPIIFKHIFNFFKKKNNKSNNLKREICNFNLYFIENDIFSFNYPEKDEEDYFSNLKKPLVSKNLIKNIFENNLINKLKNKKKKIILSKNYEHKILNKFKIKNNLFDKENFSEFKEINISKLYSTLINPAKNFNKKFFFLLDSSLKFLYKNKFNKFKNKDKYNNIIKNIIKNKLKDFYININILDGIFNILSEFNEKLKKIKDKIYDITTNLSNISLIKFNFLFIKNKSNLNWLTKISNIKHLSNSDLFIKKYNIFIKNREKNLINLELNLLMSIKKFLKIFTIIEINKFKIDIIKEDLIKSNLYIVNYICKKYSNKELYMDYIQEGNIGLINAINNYSYDLYINFKDYLTISIKRSISKFIYKYSRLIRFPSYITTLMRKINKIYKNYSYKYNENPTIKYISSKIDVSSKRIKKTLNIYRDILSTDKVIDDDNTRMSDLIKNEANENPEQILFEVELKKFLNELFSKLDTRNVEILCMRYGIDLKYRHTLSQIGVKYNLSRERIRQLQNLILNKLRHSIRLKKLKNFFTPKNKIIT